MNIYTIQQSPLSRKVSNKNIINNSFVQGFSMVEVLIAMALSTIALLGLAAAQLKSLQYASSSFNYTVSLIQANNAIERTWVNLCALQAVAVPVLNAAHVNNVQPQIPNYIMSLVPDADENFNNNLNITVRWTDTRLEDVANPLVNQNQAVVNATFPQIFPQLCP